MRHRIVIYLALAAVVTGCSTTPPTPEVTGNVCDINGNAAPATIRQDYCLEVKAPKENFLNALLIRRAWSVNKDRWTKDTLKVSFLNGNEKQHAQVRKHASKWLEHCGLAFDWSVGDPAADIRISFTCGGHWSFVGNQCSRIPRGKATMNIELSSLDFDTDWRRVVLHEFGHALGLQHEHSHPHADIEWDRQAVIEYYMATQGWSEEDVEQQVLERYKPKSDKDWTGTSWDEHSIMEYPVPWQLTTNRHEDVPWNTELTRRDIELIGKMYPKTEP